MYWRSSKSSITFHSCDTVDNENMNCIGGSAQNRSQCRKGHTGPLCMLCVDGWVIQGNKVCEVCKKSDGREKS